MAIYSLRSPSFASNLGASLGSGLGSGLGAGLQYLAENKLNQMAKKHKQTEIENVLKGLQLSPAQATFIAQLPENQRLEATLEILRATGGYSPEQEQQSQQQFAAPVEETGFRSMLASPYEPPRSPLLNNPLGNVFGQQQSQIGAGEQIQQAAPRPQIAQELPQQRAPIAQVKRGGENLAQQLKAERDAEKAAKIAKHEGKEKSAERIKQEEALIAQKNNLESIISLTDRMLKNVKNPKLHLGIGSSLKSSVSGTLLNEITNQFDKDSANLINLTSQDIKGNPTVFRVKLIEKGKVGLNQHRSVNTQILTDVNKDAKKKLHALGKRYPDLTEEKQLEERNGSVFNDLPPASEYPNRRIEDTKTGKILFSDGNSWKEA